MVDRLIFHRASLKISFSESMGKGIAEWHLIQLAVVQL
jgi:hypothetical protein